MSTDKYNALQRMLCVFLMGVAMHANAQQPPIEMLPDSLPEEVMAWTVSTIEPWQPNRYRSLKEAMIDNNFYMPLVFRGGIFPSIDYRLSRDSLMPSQTDLPFIFTYRSPLVDRLFQSYMQKKELADMAYKDVMLSNYRNFRYTRQQLPTKLVKPESIDKSTEQVKLDIKTATVSPEAVEPVVKFIPDRRYWTSSLAADIKFSHSKSTDNWYKGKIDNMNIFTNLDVSYNYAKGKVTLTNKLTSTLTINTAPNDTLRNYTAGSDELRFRSNLGLKAIRNWNYSLSAEFITSMTNKYQPNTNTKNSAFLSPYTANVGIGMTYIVNPKFKRPHRALDLKLSLEPLSLKYMYSNDTTINLGAYFPKNDDNDRYKHELLTFGSTITLTSTAKLNKHLNWTSRFYYFSNYERAISEFENKLDIILSRYFSTTLYLYLRYDDGVAKQDSYLQMSELFSFGFSYRW